MGREVFYEIPVFMMEYGERHQRLSCFLKVFFYLFFLIFKQDF